ncbi:DNA topoisomerase I (plasmid) [Deferribacter desulfuricans SSM1]|uniref:DNA topoisomerase n=1 Tax=Deferribacter desulfuricans (strain DSM 14783 / JCM 11476 / NBRC 101012 / SSM1) TaxID=639282 RepID=D3PEJ4_DEFDS|nr:type IA DNA topoisomerase [Deferribacter desulfuricans]BAI81636.1 DNA topoisomerase I [Deferribacter desulfuricans SSM1]
MSYYLVIIESPNKKQAVTKYLKKSFPDKNFIVESTIGHFRDLPKKELGVDLKTFIPKYELDKSKKPIINKIIEKAKSATEIYIATDPDREGEAIGWHIDTVLKQNKIDSSKIYRIRYNEITPKALSDAIKNKTSLDLNLIKAQETRRILDRLVGWYLSALLMQEFGKDLGLNLSAGRVQTPAVYLVYERDKKIENFKPEPYFKTTLNLIKDNIEFKATKKYKINDFDTPEKDYQKYNKLKKIKVIDVKKKNKKEPAPLPYITRTVLSDITKNYKINSKVAMNILQKLFEKGLITYHRTDSARVSDDGIKLAKSICNKLNITHLFQGNPGKKGDQDGHECIRPTKILLPNDLEKNSDLTDLDKKVYKLIFNRFIESQLIPAEVFVTTIVFEDDFKTSGKVIIKEGYLEFRKRFAAANTSNNVNKSNNKDENKDDTEQENLPDIKKGDIIDITKINKEKLMTKPPAHYTQPTLLKKLEQEKIGRPSTYASILNKIIDIRKYIIEKKEKNSDYLFITDKGIKMVEFFMTKKDYNWIINVNFTKEMEGFLDKIAKGNVNESERKNYLRKFLDILKNINLNFREDVESTNKMLNLAKDISQTLNINLPDNINKFNVCNNFIKKHYDEYIKAKKPTTKMIEVAQKFFEKDTEISEEEKEKILNSYVLCSKYIDNKIKAINSKNKSKNKYNKKSKKNMAHLSKKQSKKYNYK